jgi:hypothetical protein
LKITFFRKLPASDYRRWRPAERAEAANAARAPTNSAAGWNSGLREA